MSTASSRRYLSPDAGRPEGPSLYKARAGRSGPASDVAYHRASHWHGASGTVSRTLPPAAAAELIFPSHALTAPAAGYVFKFRSSFKNNFRQTPVLSKFNVSKIV